MISNSPTSSFVYKGTILDNPPDNFSNNNHAAIFTFGSKWYILYHNRVLAKKNGVSPDYQRSVCIDQLFYNADGTIKKVIPTVKGVASATASKQTQTPTPTLDSSRKLSESSSSVLPTEKIAPDTASKDDTGNSVDVPTQTQTPTPTPDSSRKLSESSSSVLPTEKIAPNTESKDDTDNSADMPKESSTPSNTIPEKDISPTSESTSFQRLILLLFKTLFQEFYNF